MREAYEWYFRGQIDFNKPLLEVFLHRYQLFRFVFTKAHLHEIVWVSLARLFSNTMLLVTPPRSNPFIT